MWGTRELRPALEKGVETVRKADVSLKVCIALTAACLVVGLVTLGVVLAMRAGE